MPIVNDTPWWRPIALFGRHMLNGAAVFFILTIVQISGTLLLHFITSLLQIPVFTSLTLELAERVLVIVDTTLYFLYLSWMAWKAIKEMIS